MVAKWQQWMPFHIDKFRGSQSVQAMHPSARSGYLYLLASSWQTEDCTLANDPIDLATESGLGDELWTLYGPRILRNFDVLENGRLRNSVLYDEWNKAREEFLKNHRPPEQVSEAGESSRTRGKYGKAKSAFRQVCGHGGGREAGRKK